MAALNHTQLLHALAQKTGRVVDLAYMGLVSSMTQQFFKHGFGQLELIDFHLDVELFKRWPPDHFDDAITPVEWKRVKEGSYHGHAYEVLKGTFRTPCFGKIYDALPTESRTASAMWILPKRPAHQTACMVHLAATGDHGHARRLHLGLPLVEQGIATLALESPYYGERKPGYQQGSKLHHVSDLLLLGRATIEESLFLLQWLAKQGHTQLGMAGLSMGGVHASMVASLYPGPLALTPLLAPRSAAVAYCGGALYHATAWDKIVADAEQRLGDIVRVVHSAARGGEMIAAARIKRIAEEAAALQAAQQAAQQAQHEAEAAGVEGYPGGLPAGALASPGSGSSEAISQATYIATSAAAAGAGSSQQQQQQEGAQQRLGSTTGAGSAEQPMGPPRAGAASSSKGSSWNWKRIGKWLHLYSDSLEGRLEQVQALDARDRRQQAVTVLREVLETYTDVTRFPRPQCPQAAILVAATDDAYVSCESVMELHQHWPGSEVRLVPGGHVSSFLLHHETFRQAIRDALDRLPPSCKDT